MIDYKIELGNDVNNQYQLSFSSVTDKIFSRETQRLLQDKIDVVDVDLMRLKGHEPTPFSVLKELKNEITRLLLENENVIIFYYCDYDNDIPAARKGKELRPEEYRNQLFLNLIEMMRKQQHLEDIENYVIKIRGLSSIHYVHLILRKELVQYKSLIENELREGFEKPL